MLAPRDWALRLCSARWDLGGALHAFGCRGQLVLDSRGTERVLCPIHVGRPQASARHRVSDALRHRGSARPATWLQLSSGRTRRAGGRIVDVLRSARSRPVGGRPAAQSPPWKDTPLAELVEDVHRVPAEVRPSAHAKMRPSRGQAHKRQLSERTGSLSEATGARRRRQALAARPSVISAASRFVLCRYGGSRAVKPTRPLRRISMGVPMAHPLLTAFCSFVR